MTEDAPLRIASLLPSATEIICDLGLEANLVGVSHECDYPPAVRKLPAVTSSVIPKDAASGEIDTLVREHLNSYSALYSLDLDLLDSLQPNLIVTQALCDVCAVSADDVEAAIDAMAGSPVVVNLEPMSLEDVYTTVAAVGAAASIGDRAETRVEQLRARVAAVAARTAARATETPRVAFLEWVDPLFNAGHWTPHLIELAGGKDCLGNAGAPSTTLSWDDLVSAAPDALCIACCGFSEQRARDDLAMLERHDGWQELPCVQQDRIHVFDGNAYFNRPGPRLIDSLELLAHALNPDIHPAPETLDRGNVGPVTDGPRSNVQG